MQSLLSPDTFEFLARYFIAGWLFLSTRNWWVRGQTPKPNEVLFEAITLSLINQLISLATVRNIASFISLDEDSTAFLLLEVVAQPILLGSLIGWIAVQNKLPDGIRRLFMPALTPVNSPFQFALDQLPGPTYMILSFEDGRVVYGLFSINSFANMENNLGSVYFEETYTFDPPDGSWQPTGRGAWINMVGLQTVEFIPQEDF
jgi:hypothetical protein